MVSSSQFEKPNLMIACVFAKYLFEVTRPLNVVLMYVTSNSTARKSQMHEL